MGVQIQTHAEVVAGARGHKKRQVESRCPASGNPAVRIRQKTKGLRGDLKQHWAKVLGGYAHAHLHH